MSEAVSKSHSNNSEEPDAHRFGCMLARVVSDNRCRRTRLLDVRGLSPISDFLVVATGTSDRQMRSVAEQVKQLGKEHGWSLYGSGGHEAGRWIVADFVSVVVHLFDEPSREYYDLDSLWADAERV
ncbi:MAG: ribosome silencing factor, partial [Phycisphaeraceae bacterium]|nr:ribosome silencing factor [Phycisphaeraceae bacterium]